MKTKLSSIILIALLLSCSNGDDSSEDSKTDISLVTGIFARASEFGPAFQLGNPNVKNDQIVMYPNPPVNNLAVTSLSHLPITKLWFIKGNAEKKYQSVDFVEVLSSQMYSDAEILSNSELTLTDINETNITVNLEGLSFGYYKLFLMVNDEILWNNIYIGNDKSITELDDYWN